MANNQDRASAWKASIFATNKFSADLRRRNTVRDIFYEGYSARDAEVEALKSSTRYALATFRALDRYTFEDSDHGLLIAEAVKKLEAALSGGEEKDEVYIQA